MSRKDMIAEKTTITSIGTRPRDWNIKRLGEICEFLDSQRIPIKDAERQKRKGKYPYYGASGIIDYIDEYLFDGEYILLGEDGANIITRSSPLAFRVSGKIWVNNHAHILTTKDNYDIDFVCALLESLNYIKYNTGTAQPKLNREVCEHIPLSIPPFFEQQKIAEILSLWDKAIEKQSQLISQLELRKKGLMQQLLTGKKRLPGFEGKWKEWKLSSLGTFFKGSGVPKNEISKEGFFKCLTYGDLYTKYDIVIKDVKSYISHEIANNSQKIQYGDICFAGSGETPEDIGKCAVYIDDEIGYAGGDIIIFRCKKQQDPIYLSYLLNSHDIRKQKYSLSQGHSVVHIYTQHLKDLRLLVPLIKEQNAIVNVLRQADIEMESQQKKLEHLHSQKRGLMQQLLTGKIRVK